MLVIFPLPGSLIRTDCSLGFVGAVAISVAIVGVGASDEQEDALCWTGKPPITHEIRHNTDNYILISQDTLIHSLHQVCADHQTIYSSHWPTISQTKSAIALAHAQRQRPHRRLLTYSIITIR